MSRFTLILRKYEPLLFSITAFLFLHELFSSSYLVTADGASHLYNAAIMHELFTNKSAIAHQLNEINSLPVPNSLSHFILLALLQFFNPIIAAKIFHSILIIGLVFSFRLLQRQICASASYLSWLIFPFAMPDTFYMGFYNFTLGGILCLLVVAYWIYLEKRKINGFATLILSLLITALYFSHLIQMMFACIIIGIRISTTLINKDYRKALTQTGLFFVSALPSAILFLCFTSNRTEVITGNSSWHEAIDSLIRIIKPVHLGPHDERQAISVIVIALAVWIVFIYKMIGLFRSKQFIITSEPTRWLITLLILIVLIFIIPDDFSGSGAVTIRLTQFFWLILIIFIASISSFWKMDLTAALVLLFCGIMLMIQRKQDVAELNRDGSDALWFADKVSPGKTGAYLYCGENSLKQNTGCLAFIKSRVGLITNYESYHDYFPLRNIAPMDFNFCVAGNGYSDVRFFNTIWEPSPSKPKKNVDYILVNWDGKKDSVLMRQFFDSLSKYYMVKANKGDYALYELK
jgi:hypothetical protein